MYMNDELVMSPSFPFQLKTYEEAIMNQLNDMST